uniref:(northern house mosquito) hypothetical protein n=1 Tax=Culex pipiens TaxID=7175 RepID=A0A8D8P503_CULPI
MKSCPGFYLAMTKWQRTKWATSLRPQTTTTTIVSRTRKSSTTTTSLWAAKPPITVIICRTFTTLMTSCNCKYFVLSNCMWYKRCARAGFNLNSSSPILLPTTATRMINERTNLPMAIKQTGIS